MFCFINNIAILYILYIFSGVINIYLRINYHYFLQANIVKRKLINKNILLVANRTKTHTFFNIIIILLINILNYIKF